MFRKFFVTLSLAVLAAFPALAAEDLLAVAQSYAPAGATLVEQETHGHVSEFEFYLRDTQEFLEIEVNAQTRQVQRADYSARNDQGSAVVSLTQEQAQAQVLAQYPDAQMDFVWLDKEDGLSSYKVSFTSKGMSGVVTVHPESGALLKRELTYAASANSTGASLTMQQAQAAVLDRVSGGVLTYLVQSTEDGQLIYQGEVTDATTRYEFEIDAATGRFLEWEREPLRTDAEPSEKPAPAPDASGLIGTARAKSIALEKAGSGRVSRIKLDREGGRQVYEGKVVTDQYEYDFEIDAVSGTVREWEKERLDSPAEQAEEEREEREEREEEERERREEREDRDDDDDDDD